MHLEDYKMSTPYKILHIDVDAKDSEIKQAYLQQVKRNPPDKNQQQFQLIHHAYNAIKDHKSRVSHQLFTPPSIDFTDVIDRALATDKIRPLTLDNLTALLNASIDETDVLNTSTPIEKP